MNSIQRFHAGYDSVQFTFYADEKNTVGHNYFAQSLHRALGNETVTKALLQHK